MLLGTVTGLLGTASGTFALWIYQKVLATQTDRGLVVAAIITGFATVIAGACSVINTYLLTRVRRRQEVIRNTAEEGAQSLIQMAHDAARAGGTARREVDNDT